MKLFLFLFFAFLNNVNYAQTPIFLSDYNVTITPLKCCDTIQKKRGEKTIIIYLTNCKGEMECEVYENKKLIERGGYKNSLDTLVSYSKQVSRGVIRPSKIIVYKYFQPLRDGEWIFYDRNKKIFQKKYFDMGIEIKEN